MTKMILFFILFLSKNVLSAPTGRDYAIYDVISMVLLSAFLLCMVLALVKTSVCFCPKSNQKRSRKIYRTTRTPLNDEEYFASFSRAKHGSIVTLTNMESVQFIL